MDADELARAGLARQAELVAAGEVSARELVESSLERIERHNPRLNAFRVVFAERALTEADQADARRRGGDVRPLLGVPVAIKDDTDVAGEVSAWGSAAAGRPATEDAEMVRRLRQAGAIVVGKTNVPELMIWPFTESERFGPTRNPWNPEHTPGGSSGGSAAAVASGMVGGASGSDGGGSVRIPAACCGIFGIKPQRGRIPLSPRPEAWLGLSVNGPLTRRVRDAALFLDVVSGPGPADRDRLPAPERSFVEAAASPPGRLRVAVSAKVPRGSTARVHPEIRRALEQTADLLASLGHATAWVDPDYGTVMNSFMVRYLSGIREDARSMPTGALLEPRTRGMARMGGVVAPLAPRARRQETAHAERINRIFDRHDVVMIPTLAVPPPRVGRWEGRGALATINGVAGFAPFTGVWNHLGQPAASVPAGFSPTGLPLAVQLLGRPSDEATLLSLAAQMEAERPWATTLPALA